MSSLTLEETLELPLLKQAHPVVLAGHTELHRRVRWVHASELADIAPLLRQGDLVLSTGIALPGTAEELDAFALSLNEIGAAGLLLELGRRWASAPLHLIEACEKHSLPLVALSREVKFAAIAQVVGERVVDQQLEELRQAEQVHETFTDLSLAEAGPREILGAVQRLAGSAVVLESDQHRVLDYIGGPENMAEFLNDWQVRSRRIELSSRTHWDEANGWLLTRLGSQDRRWGRLILHSSAPPSQRLIVLIERAASALAMHRLHDRDRDNFIRRTHHELLVALQNEPLTPDTIRRCDLAGFPVANRQFVGICVRPRVGNDEARSVGRGATEEVLSALVHACNQRDLPALIAEVDGDIRVLLSVGKAVGVDSVLDQLATQVTGSHAAVVGAGRSSLSADGIGWTLREAQQVVEAVRPGDEPEPSRHYFELLDVHIRGLLSLWGEDDRLSLFASRELGVLKAHDQEHQSQLIETLRALLEHESKADAAHRLHLSRAAFYSRLARIEAVLGVRLDDVEMRTSLHVALIANDLAAQRTQHADVHGAVVQR